VITEAAGERSGEDLVMYRLQRAPRIYYSGLFALAAVCLAASLGQGIAAEGEVDRAGDAHLESLYVAPEDREECSLDQDCDDWCKEKGSARCGCRCPKFASDADFGCSSALRHCQALPRNFWGGSLNITAQSFSKICKKHINLAVVFSATSCLHCTDFEPAYRWATPSMEADGVSVARIDVDSNKEFADDHGVTSLPAIKMFHKCKPKGSYKGVHSIKGMRNYTKKVTGQPYTHLRTRAEVAAFAKAHPISIIGFFEKPDMESDEVDDFAEAATDLQYSHNTYFGMVNKRDVMAPFKGQADSFWIKKSPSIVIFRNTEEGGVGDDDDQERDALLMSELNTNLRDWIMQKSVRLVDEITNHNFVYYESLKRPMVLLFLDRKAANRGVLNAIKAVARRHENKLTFGWLDGHAYAGKMSALGLTSGTLPALAINTMQHGRFAFPASGEFTEAAISQWIDEFIAGRLEQGSQAESAAARGEGGGLMSKSPEPVKGLVEVSKDTFISEVLQDSQHDVVVLFHTSTQESSSNFHLYWKKVVERFSALGIKSVKLARYDVANHQVPREVDFEATPAIIMFPASDKTPPFPVFHGKGKVRPIMLWVQQVANIKFDFPNDTPHLDEEQREAYLVQIKERDERVNAERAKKKEERIAKLDKGKGEL